MEVKEMKIIKQEKPAYFTLMMRKSSKVKILETIAFIVLIMLLSVKLGFEHPYFKFAAIAGAVLALGLSPLIYRIVVKPEYTLTETELIINKFSQETRFPLTKVKNSYDLKFFYLLDGKKTPLTVSNDFLEELDNQIVLLKRKLN